MAEKGKAGKTKSVTRTCQVCLIKDVKDRKPRRDMELLSLNQLMQGNRLSFPWAAALGIGFEFSNYSSTLEISVSFNYIKIMSNGCHRHSLSLLYVELSALVQVMS